MIENLEYYAPDDKTMEGTFISRIFKNDGDDRLSILLEDDTIKDYAEKCVEHFNNMSDEMIDTICKGIIKCAEAGGLNEEFELPELKTIRDILKYCWFTNLAIFIPEGDEIAYTVEGEGEWEEGIDIAIRGNKVLYVGYDFGDSPWADEDYYKNLDSNCI